MKRGISIVLVVIFILVVVSGCGDMVRFVYQNPHLNVKAKIIWM